MQHQYLGMKPRKADSHIGSRKDCVMFELPFIVLGLGMLCYLEEWTSENPSLMRAAVFVGAVIQSTVCLAFRA